ncbi:Derlin-3 [Golovinomyces cichoracearum]|uniref:Derlin n=1 Tax=Golovinomyces cichoracearum TaxID=62708 RepID=A0A420J2B5_9PEZI|nr:Derlin-3 [Golovinomyces cichoracearum]
MDAFWKAPPISRTLAASAFLLSVSVYTGLVPGYLVIFLPKSIFKFPPQLWRLFTSFLITGKELGIIFDTFFIYQYGSRLESASPRFTSSGDFIAYIFFVCTTILGLNIFVAGGYVFTTALVLALAYTSSQDDRGNKANFFIVTIPAVWVPYAMLLMTLIMAGPDAAKVQLTGLVAAHLHDFLTRLWPKFGGGNNLFPTPRFLSSFWLPHQLNESRRPFGTVTKPINPPNAVPSMRSSKDVLPKSWQSRGSGHRLGGD